MAGNILLKPGDEVVFVLHTNLKSGEINACRWAVEVGGSCILFMGAGGRAYVLPWRGDACAAGAAQSSPPTCTPSTLLTPTRAHPPRCLAAGCGAPRRARSCRLPHHHQVSWLVWGRGGGHGWHPPARPQSEKPAVHLTVCSPFLFSCRSALHIVLLHSAAPLTPAKAAPPHSPASPFALPCLLAPPPHPPPPPAACRARAPRARCQPQQDPADWQPAEEHCLCQAPHCPRARWLRWL